jgi:hypothetical protein
MRSKNRQYIYGVLAVAGLLATWYFNFRFMEEHDGFSVAAFLAGGYANAAASSLTSDLTVGVLAFLVLLVAESRRLEMSRPWVYVALTFGVAFAFAFPLFLLMRERRLASLERAAG